MIATCLILLALAVDPLDDAEQRANSVHVRLERQNRRFDEACAIAPALAKKARETEKTSDKVNQDAQQFAKNERGILNIVGDWAPWALPVLTAVGGAEVMRRRKGQPSKPNGNGNGQAKPMKLPTADEWADSFGNVFRKSDNVLVHPAGT